MFAGNGGVQVSTSHRDQAISFAGLVIVLSVLILIAWSTLHTRDFHDLLLFVIIWGFLIALWHSAFALVRKVLHH